jgi:ribosome-binding protein aMBF1 (putative translation factor)
MSSKLYNAKKPPNQVLVLTVERQRKGWSRLELARRSKNAPSDISRFESGRVVPYDVQLRRIARALGWRVADAHHLLDTAQPNQMDAAVELVASCDR